MIISLQMDLEISYWNPILYIVMFIIFLGDRAKAIKTTATVNDKLIQALREVNARLMEMVKSRGMLLPPDGVGTGGGGSVYSADGKV